MKKRLKIFGQCEAWEVETIWAKCVRLGMEGLFEEMAREAEVAPRRCPSFGRRVIERDEFGRKRSRIICWYHGLDTAPADAIVPLFPAEEDSTLERALRRRRQEDRAAMAFEEEV